MKRDAFLEQCTGQHAQEQVTLSEASKQSLVHLAVVHPVKLANGE